MIIMDWLNIVDLKIIIGTILLGGYISYLYRKLTYFKRINIPYVTPVPFLGNMARAIFRREHVCDTVKRLYDLDPDSKYVGFYDFHNALIMIRDPEVIKNIGVKHFDNFMNHRPFVDESVDPLFGKNLFALQGQKWKEVRNLLTPAFTASKMRMMFELINQCAKGFTDYLINDVTKTNADVEMKDVFVRYTNDIIASCAFGISTDSMRNPNNEFYLMGKKVTNFRGLTFLKLFFIRSFPNVSKLFNIRIMDEAVVHFFKNTIQDAIEFRDREKITRPDMLQLMMEARGKTSNVLDLNIDDITAQAFIFFVAGFDTASILMCFLCMLLAINPTVQDKLQNEVDSVMEESDGKPTYEKIVSMPYLDAVINETLRLYPPAPFMDRICESDFELPPNKPGDNPITVKKGDTIWFPAYGIHRDPKYYADPETFDPDRFINFKVTLNQPTYLPFGIGPRACIGNRFALLENKAVLFYLVSICTFKLSEKTKLPLRFDKRTFQLLVEGDFWLKLEKRDKKV